MTYETIQGKPGSGKTYQAIQRLIADAEQQDTPKLYAFVGPQYQQAFSNLYGHPWGEKLACVRRARGEFELASGSRIRVYSECNLDPARGLRFRAVVADNVRAWKEPDDVLAKLHRYFGHVDVGTITTDE